MREGVTQAVGWLSTTSTPDGETVSGANAAAVPLPGGADDLELAGHLKNRRTQDHSKKASRTPSTNSYLPPARCSPPPFQHDIAHLHFVGAVVFNGRFKAQFLTPVQPLGLLRGRDHAPPRRHQMECAK